MSITEWGLNMPSLPDKVQDYYRVKAEYHGPKVALTMTAEFFRIPLQQVQEILAVVGIIFD